MPFHSGPICLPDAYRKGVKEILTALPAKYRVAMAGRPEWWSWQGV